ncbi:MAG: hypothetical protein EXR07_14860 [Acetobacteraceae bacterium]|nr:hypothetical protein [Acetobacteraceae bacterium]
MVDVRRVTRFAGCVSLVLLVVLIPLFAVSIPPLHDYPFHLARVDILASLSNSAFLRARYEQSSFLFPNVGMDAVMAPLLRVLPALLAGRVFLGLTLTLILTGTIALHAALHRRLSLWPLLAGFFLYNWIFLYGFLNYLIGVGLMLWATAGWVMLRERATGWHMAWASAMAVALLFCHLVVLGLFGIVIAGMELQRASRTWRTDRAATLRDLASAAIPFVIALIIFIMISHAALEAHQRIEYHGGRAWKPLMAVRSLLTTVEWLDVLTLTPLLAGIVLAIWRRRFRLATSMVLPLCLLAVTFAVMPFYIFGSEFGDARLPIAILLVAIASTNLDGPERRTSRLIGLCALGLLLARSVAIARDWVDSDARLASFVAAFRLIPDGATLYAATAAPYPSIDYRDAAGLALWHPPLKHVAALASLGRDVFVPSTWSNPLTQPMRVVASMNPINAFHGEIPLKTPGSAELNTMVGKIHEFRPLLGLGAGTAQPPDYLLLIAPDRFQGDLPAGSVTVARGADFVLLRVP